MKDLNEIEKKNPFGVPDNYFEEFKTKITESTSGEAVLRKETGIIYRLRPYFAVAASIAVLAVLGFLAANFFRGQGRNLGVPEITFNEFADIYLDDIDILTLEEIVAAEGIIQEESGVSNDDIIDYLVLENIDVYEIYDQL